MSRYSLSVFRLFAIVAVLVVSPAFAADPGWPAYGGDQGGQR